MNKATVLPGQTFADVAVRYKGRLEDIMELAVSNGRSITDAIVAGEELVVGEANNKALVRYLNNNNIMPATGATVEADVAQQQEGIDYWAIEKEFIVL